MNYAELTTLGEFDAEGIEEIKWSEDAFAKLVLPDGEKDVLLASLTRDEHETNMQLDEFIPDKGMHTSLHRQGETCTVLLFNRQRDHTAALRPSRGWKDSHC
jgi:hypothetical protein